jgi:hypothetical protein
MSRKKHSEKNMWDGKTAFEQLQLASQGTKKLDRKVWDFVMELDHVIDCQKRNSIPNKKVWRLYRKELWEKFVEIFWACKIQKNGDAFRQIAWILDDECVRPDWAVVARIKLEHERLNAATMPPIAWTVKFFNEKFAKPPQPETSFTQIKRIYQALNVEPPPAKRGPKPGIRRKKNPRRNL